MTINKKYFANLITFYCIICHLSFIECFSIPSKNVNLKLKIPYTTLKSTPFDISLYDDEDANPFFDALNPLACPPGTQLILGINKYSHDTTLCAADATTGKVLFGMSKERLTRKKHHGGNVASLVETCLDQLELDVDDIKKVVVNNHHHRVLHMEDNIDHLEWQVGLGINEGAEGGFTDEENLFSDTEKLEISHHLAHAYSAACQCPFEDGLVVIMDGMGETYRTMRAAIDNNDKRYISDLQFEGEFECIPSNIRQMSEKSIFDWREAESAYEFVKKDGRNISLKVRIIIVYGSFVLKHLLVAYLHNIIFIRHQY